MAICNCLIGLEQVPKEGMDWCSMMKINEEEEVF